MCEIDSIIHMSERLLPSMHHSWAPSISWHRSSALITTPITMKNEESIRRWCWNIPPVLWVNICRQAPCQRSRRDLSGWFIRAYPGVHSALASLMALDWSYVWWIHCVFVAADRDVDWSFSGSLCWWWGTLLWVLSLKSGVIVWIVDTSVLLLELMVTWWVSPMVSGIIITMIHTVTHAVWID